MMNFLMMVGAMVTAWIVIVIITFAAIGCPAVRKGYLKRVLTMGEKMVDDLDEED